MGNFKGDLLKSSYRNEKPKCQSNSSAQPRFSHVQSDIKSVYHKGQESL